MALPTFSMDEVAKHNTKDDCWVVLFGTAYDLTKFARAHPGGAKIIYENAGKDATAPFKPVHPSDIMERLLKPAFTMGPVDPASIKAEHVAPPPEAHAPPPPAAAPVAGALAVAAGPFVKPPIGAMLNCFDMESVAREVMDPQGWGYYSSGGDDEITLRDNHASFQRIVMRPRILKNVGSIDMTTDVLGVLSSLPVYFSATALGKLADPEGEQAIVRAAKKAGVVYMLPTLSSCSLNEMLSARAPGQVVWSQLYVNPDRSRSEVYLRNLEDAGVEAVFVTVDAPQLGRREKDMRSKYTKEAAKEQDPDEAEDKVDRSQGAARAISSFIDPSFCWDDIPWLKASTKLPIFLKGVQCGEDAALAYQAGLAGCVLSNHGGRQLDTCRSGIEVLPEVMEALRDAGATKEQFKVFVDGGIRRGADIFKAIALGATAVGLGRPVLYSLAAYGEKGVVRMVDMLQDELQMVMRLSGCPSIKHITRAHVITKNLGDHIVPQPMDRLQYETYQGLMPAARL